MLTVGYGLEYNTGMDEYTGACTGEYTAVKTEPDAIYTHEDVARMIKCLMDDMNRLTIRVAYLECKFPADFE